MEIEEIRKELNHLLNSVVDHSTKYSDERPIPSLEISFVLTKINKMKENLVVLNYLLKEKEKASKKARTREKEASVAPRIEAREGKKEDDANEQGDEIETTENSDVTLADNNEQSAVSKLVDALTLNDRYLYANELFDKDMNTFNELVKSIDNSSSLAEAKGLFLPNWEEENEHVQSFTELVERRFS